MKNSIMIFCILALTAGTGLLSTAEDSNVSEIKTNVELTFGLKASQYKDIYFSGQPDLKKLVELKEKGFTNIINLRQSSEGSYKESQEKAAAENLKLNYTHIPMKGSDPLTNEMITQITKAIVKNRKSGKTLIHCGSGKRVAVWVGGHFYKDHGTSKEDAIQIPEKVGLGNGAFKKALDKYLNQ